MSLRTHWGCQLSWMSPFLCPSTFRSLPQDLTLFSALLHPRCLFPRPSEGLPLISSSHTLSTYLERPSSSSHCLQKLKTSSHQSLDTERSKRRERLDCSGSVSLTESFIERNKTVSKAWVSNILLSPATGETFCLGKAKMRARQTN